MLTCPGRLVIPGLITMQMTSLLGPVRQCFGIKKDKKAKDKALAEFDQKTVPVADSDGSVTATSVTTRTSRGNMFSYQSLEDCLNRGPDFHDFLEWCATKAFNSENVKFCDRVVKFKNEWSRVFAPPNQGVDYARLAMYKIAVVIYIDLVDEATTYYTINIEGLIKNNLCTLFGHNAKIMAARRPSSAPQSPAAHSAVVPWETSDADGHALGNLSRPSLNKGCASSTTELIGNYDEDSSAFDPGDQMDDFVVPEAFDKTCFDAAMASVKHMLWQQPWQEFMRSKRTSASASTLA